MTTGGADDARRLMEAAERIAEATRVVDTAAGDPFGINFRLRAAVRRAQAEVAERTLNPVFDDAEEATS